MGCCNSPPSLPPDAPKEERAFAAREAELGYSKNSASHNLAVIQKNSDGTKILKFDIIAQELGLKIAEFDNPEVAMGKFYQKLKEKGKYDQLKLSLMGVLLGRGPLKPALLFACIAHDSQSPLESVEIRAFFNALFYISADALPVLTLAQEKEPETPKQPSAPCKLTEYVTLLKSGKDSLAERCTNLVMKGRGKVTMQDFVEAFEGEERLRELVTPFAVRLALKREAQIVQSAGIPKNALI